MVSPIYVLAECFSSMYQLSAKHLRLSGIFLSLCCTSNIVESNMCMLNFDLFQQKLFPAILIGLKRVLYSHRIQLHQLRTVGRYGELLRFLFIGQNIYKKNHWKLREANQIITSILNKVSLLEANTNNVV